MPLLAGIPVVSYPEDLPAPDFTDSRTLALRSLDGEDLLPFQGREFFLLSGIDGLELPPRELVTERTPGMDGTRIRDIRIGEREVFLPLFMGSDSSHLAYLDDRSRLWRLFNHRTVDYRATEGTFDLVANSVRGERSLRCLYKEGWGGGHGTDDEGSVWMSIGLKALAVQPYWSGDPWTTPPIYAPEGEPWFGSFPGELSSTRALGENIPVEVTGDVDSWVQVDVTGPASSVTVRAPGLLVNIPAGLAAGERTTIITDPRGRTALFDGVKDWSRIGPTTRWAPLSPGPTVIDVIVPGATSGADGTVAAVSGRSLWEMPW